MKPTRLSALIAGASLFMAGQAFAAGYYVDEQSALRLGDAFSGGSASASDASAAFYGPASMILLKDQLVVNAAVLPVTTKFKGEATTVTGEDIDGGNAKTDTTDVLPSAYFAKHLADDLVIGVYVNAPYATGSKFGKTSKARYQAADSEITGIDLGASFAARVNDHFTLGGGLIMQYMKAETGVAINTELACLDAGMDLDMCAGLINDFDPGSDSNDGYFKMKGSNVAFGYQLGALIEFSENSRLGLNYRSQIRHSIAGDATVTSPTNTFTSFAGLAGTNKADGRVQLNTPETADASYFHQLGKLSLQGTAAWTNWSRFKELAVESRDPLIQKLTDEPTQYNWKENYRLAIGAGYQVSDALTVRTGFAFDKTPIKSKDVKADFAFDDYKALSVGATYGFTDTLFLDAGLQHTFKQDRKINNPDPVSGSELTGKVTTEVTTVALGLRWLM